MSRDSYIGFIVFILCLFSKVNSRSCPAIPNVAQVCTPGTFSGARVLVDMSSFTGQSENCSCSFNTSAKVLKIVTYNAPNYQDCNSAIRLSSSSGNSVRFECLMSGTYLDTSTHNTGEVMFETYAAAYDNNYCLVMELADAPGSEITLTCEGIQETTTQLAAGTTQNNYEILVKEPTATATMPPSVSTSNQGIQPTDAQYAATSTSQPLMSTDSANNSYLGTTQSESTIQTTIVSSSSKQVTESQTTKHTSSIESSTNSAIGSTSTETASLGVSETTNQTVQPVTNSSSFQTSTLSSPTSTINLEVVPTITETAKKNESITNVHTTQHMTDSTDFRTSTVSSSSYSSSNATIKSINTETATDSLPLTTSQPEQATTKVAVSSKIPDIKLVNIESESNTMPLTTNQTMHSGDVETQTRPISSSTSVTNDDFKSTSTQTTTIIMPSTNYETTQPISSNSQTSTITPVTPENLSNKNYTLPELEPSQIALEKNETVLSLAQNTNNTNVDSYTADPDISKNSSEGSEPATENPLTISNETTVTEIVSGTVLLHGGDTSEKRYQTIDLVKSNASNTASVIVPTTFKPPEMREVGGMSFVTEQIKQNGRFNQDTTTATYRSTGPNANVISSTSNYWLTNAYTGKDTVSSRSNNEITTNIYGIAIENTQFRNADYNQYGEMTMSNNMDATNATEGQMMTGSPVDSAYDSTRAYTGKISTPNQNANVDYNSYMAMTTSSYGVNPINDIYRTPLMESSSSASNNATQSNTSRDSTTYIDTNSDYNPYMTMSTDSLNTQAHGQVSLSSFNDTGDIVSQTNSVNNAITNTYESVDAISYNNMQYDMNTDKSLYQSRYESSHSRELSTASPMYNNQVSTTVGSEGTGGSLGNGVSLNNYDLPLNDSLASITGYNKHGKDETTVAAIQLNSDDRNTNENSQYNITFDGYTEAPFINYDVTADSYIKSADTMAINVSVQSTNQNTTFDNYDKQTNMTDVALSNLSSPIEMNTTESSDNFTESTFVKNDNQLNLSTTSIYAATYNEPVQNFDNNTDNTNSAKVDFAQTTETINMPTETVMTTNQPLYIETKSGQDEFTTNTYNSNTPIIQTNNTNTSSTYTQLGTNDQLATELNPNWYQNNETSDYTYKEMVNTSPDNETTGISLQNASINNNQNVSAVTETSVNNNIGFEESGISFISEMKPTAAIETNYPTEQTYSTDAAEEKSDTTQSIPVDTTKYGVIDTRQTTVLDTSKRQDKSYTSETRSTTTPPILYPTEVYANKDTSHNLNTDSTNYVRTAEWTRAATDATAVTTTKDYVSSSTPSVDSTSYGSPSSKSGASVRPWTESVNSANNGFSTSTKTSDVGSTFRTVGNVGSLIDRVDATNIQTAHSTVASMYKPEPTYTSGAIKAETTESTSTLNGFSHEKTTPVTHTSINTAFIVPENEQVVEEKMFATNTFESFATNNVDGTSFTKNQTDSVNETSTMVPESSTSDNLLGNFSLTVVDSRKSFMANSLSIEDVLSTDSPKDATNGSSYFDVNSQDVSKLATNAQFNIGNGSTQASIIESNKVAPTVDTNVPNNELITTESQQSTKTVVKLESTVSSNLDDIFPTTVPLPDDEVVTINEIQTPTAIPSAPDFVDTLDTTSSSKATTILSVSNKEITTDTAIKSSAHTETIMNSDSMETTIKPIVQSISTSKAIPPTTTVKSTTEAVAKTAHSTVPSDISTSDKISESTSVKTIPRIPPKIVARDPFEKQDRPVLKNLPPVIEMKPTTKRPLLMAPARTELPIDDVTGRESQTTRPKDENMNVSFGDNFKAGLFDVNNNTYIIVVAIIAGLVVLAAVIGIYIHHKRTSRSDKIDISGANGVEPISHKNIAFENGDPETGNGNVQPSENGVQGNGATIELSENGVNQENGNKGSIEE